MHSHLVGPKELKAIKAEITKLEDVEAFVGGDVGNALISNPDVGSMVVATKSGPLFFNPGDMIIEVEPDVFKALSLVDVMYTYGTLVRA